MDKLLVVIGAISLIGAITWWFFGPKSSVTAAATQNKTYQSAAITVDGGYKPGIISLQLGKSAQITFLRKDPSSCLEAVIMPDFGVSENLPLNKPLVVTFTPDHTGDFTYTCGMRMFSGKIIVV